MGDIRPLLWLDCEKDVLRAHYSVEGAIWCARRMKGRSVAAVTAKARRMGLWSGVRRASIWTRAEDLVLLEHYPKVGLEGCMALLPRRTGLAVETRARHIRAKMPRFRSRSLPVIVPPLVAALDPQALIAATRAQILEEIARVR